MAALVWILAALASWVVSLLAVVVVVTPRLIMLAGSSNGVFR